MSVPAKVEMQEILLISIDDKRMTVIGNDHRSSAVKFLINTCKFFRIRTLSYIFDLRAITPIVNQGSFDVSHAARGAIWAHLGPYGCGAGKNQSSRIPFLHIGPVYGIIVQIHTLLLA